MFTAVYLVFVVAGLLVGVLIYFVVGVVGVLLLLICLSLY